MKRSHIEQQFEMLCFSLYSSLHLIRHTIVVVPDFVDYLICIEKKNRMGSRSIAVAHAIVFAVLIAIVNCDIRNVRARRAGMCFV